jgi:ArsR family transcriptional regulator
MRSCADKHITGKERIMQKEVALFKVLSDATRLRLASLLLANGETCVCVLAQALNEPDFKISRHLGVMRSAGLVEARREGTWMYYRLVEPSCCFEQALQEFLRTGLTDHPTLKKDLASLPDASCEIITTRNRKDRACGNNIPDKSKTATPEGDAEAPQRV